MPSVSPLKFRPGTRDLRLASGLVLFTYLATHLLNHALGLVSLAAAEAGRDAFLYVWRSLPGTAAFYGALLLHFTLALHALVERRSLRIPPAEALRIALGLTIPLLLANHVTQTRLAVELQAVDDSYARVVAGMWAGGATATQFTLIAVAWVHGCMGLNFAFRHQARFRRWQPLLLVGAVLLPVLAATGYLAMARELVAAPPAAPLPQVDREAIADTADAVFFTPWVLLAAALAARAARNAWARAGRRHIRIAYPDRTVEVPAGFSVLEASRAHGIAHLSLCGGRGRCSTCRIRVDADPAALPPPGPEERATLDRIGAPPAVRLACQLRPLGDLKVRPLLNPRTPDFDIDAWGVASEREIVVLFADLRRWTGISQEQLPFDLVYVLDQYFEAVGDSVREAGGVPNQFIGDSVMALFGLETDLDTAARQALDAASRTARRMAELNEKLAGEFGRRLDFGMGIHAGTAVVGTVGYRETRTLTAVGDAVNTASRLQELTKQFGSKLVVSDDVLRRAPQPHNAWDVHDIAVRGRQGLLRVHALVDCPDAE